MNEKLPVAIIGGGPVGLSAVAHLLERGEIPILFEAGETIAANIRQWQHVRMFSPWEYVVDSASVTLLEKSGWQIPPIDALPTGGDLIDLYLEPFAQLPEVQPHIHLSSKVVAISRENTDKMKDAGRDDAPFILHVQGADGRVSLVRAKAVLDSSGTWSQPNPIGAHGIAAPGEQEHSERIAYGIPEILGKDRQDYANQRVLVVGSGHSAINALLELGKLQEEAPDTELFWAMRSVRLQQVYGGGEDDALPARGALGIRMQELVSEGRVQIVSPFYLDQIEETEEGLSVSGMMKEERKSILVDRIIGATGSRPDLMMLRELRLNLDSTVEATPLLAPMIDPNLHSCGTVRPHGEAELRHPEQNFYIVGMKSYGRAPTFLLATGYEQVRSVVAYLVGDLKAAREVHLNLPETGVCITDVVTETGSALLQGVQIGLETIQVNAGRGGSSCCG